MKEANIDAHAPNKNDPRINKPIKIDMDKNRINICFFLSETDMIRVSVEDVTFIRSVPFAHCESHKTKTKTTIRKIFSINLSFSTLVRSALFATLCVSGQGVLLAPHLSAI